MNSKLDFKKSISEMCLLDDILMNAVFDENKEATGAILRIIMSKDDLEVIDVKAQSVSQNLEGRSTRFDVKAVDRNGTYYDIEVQRATSGASPKRVRFNAAMMDKKLLDSGEDWSNLPQLCIIFITEHDIFKDNKPIYHIRRMVDGEKIKRFEDQEEVIYVNCAYNDGNIDTDIEKLIHDFKCTNPEQLEIPELKESVDYFKNKKEGRDKVSEMIKKFYEQEIDFAKQESAYNQMVEDIKRSYKIAKLSFDSDEAVKNVAAVYEKSIAFIKKILGI